ncbi:nucleotidyltransferase family protein [Longivirga aurantiaca]|uniref:NTP transferase domain-containing protein n=1 Tax=Longivirga aurantiaca TaxID=1837743 RepID=A0ABW1T3R7_9ACTN
MSGSTAGLVLAAGEGRRFGGPKAPYVLDGERLVDRAVHLLRDAECEPVVVVLGAWVGRVDDADITVVNADWASGMGSSLRLGLDTLVGTEADRVVVTLVDLPGLSPEAVRRLVDSGSDLAQAAYAGERGHPVLLGRGHWPGVRDAADGDRGARAYLAAHDVALVEVGDVASGEDLDERPA